MSKRKREGERQIKGETQRQRQTDRQTETEVGMRDANRRTHRLIVKLEETE